MKTFKTVSELATAYKFNPELLIQAFMDKEIMVTLDQKLDMEIKEYSSTINPFIQKQIHSNNAIAKYKRFAKDANIKMLEFTYKLIEEEIKITLQEKELHEQHPETIAYVAQLTEQAIEIQEEIIDNLKQQLNNN